MKARLTATVVALILTATTFCSAQIDPGVRVEKIESADRMIEEMDRFGSLLDELLGRDLRDGSLYPPDPCRYGDLLPAVRNMIDFCNEMRDDARYAEIKKLLEEIEALLITADSEGMTEEMAERMAVDYFRIMSLLQDLPASGLR
jgi:hypothetical protein